MQLKPGKIIISTQFGTLSREESKQRLFSSLL